MRPRTTVEQEVSRKFGTPAPTLLSRLGKAPPIGISLVASPSAMDERSRITRAEDAYVVHVLLRPAPTFTQLWVGGREHPLLVQQGGVMIAHLESEPSVRFHSDFQFLRFWLAQETLDELAQESSGGKSPGLRGPEFGAPDTTLFHLAASAAPLLQRGGVGEQMLIDQLALALHSHVTSAYGGSRADLRTVARGGLAPWQERRVKEFIRSNLDRSLTLQAIADECGLSASHFSRAFKHSTGRTPHRWLLERRIESSKTDLLKADLPLSEIARRSGFSDPSHFSRVFSNLTGQTPAGWRRSRGAIGFSRDPSPLGATA